MSGRRAQMEKLQKRRKAFLPLAFAGLAVAFLAPKEFVVIRAVFAMLCLCGGLVSDFLRRKIRDLGCCPHCQCFLAEDILNVPDGEQVICRGCGKEIPNPLPDESE